MRILREVADLVGADLVGAGSTSRRPRRASRRPAADSPHCLDRPHRGLPERKDSFAGCIITLSARARRFSWMPASRDCRYRASSGRAGIRLRRGLRPLVHHLLRGAIERRGVGNAGTADVVEAREIELHPLRPSTTLSLPAPSQPVSTAGSRLGGPGRSSGPRPCLRNRAALRRQSVPPCRPQPREVPGPAQRTPVTNGWNTSNACGNSDLTISTAPSTRARRKDEREREREQLRRALADLGRRQLPMVDLRLVQRHVDGRLGIGMAMFRTGSTGTDSRLAPTSAPR